MTASRRQFLGAAAVSTFAAAITSDRLTGEKQLATRSRVRAVAFDALVIFDLAIVARRAEEEFPGKGLELTNLWRTRQFEYTWLRTAGERYRDFWDITEDALNYACASMKLQLSAIKRHTLMKAYHELETWPDVLEVLTQLKHHKIRVAFLTNFTADMISKNLRSTELSRFFEDHLTTDRVGAFKPSPLAYQMALDHFGYRREEIVFVAFAPWDVAGAKWFGYPTAWINRVGAPAEELDVSP
jgi:2-haloacid dehalogenase